MLLKSCEHNIRDPLDLYGREKGQKLTFLQNTKALKMCRGGGIQSGWTQTFSLVLNAGK